MTYPNLQHISDISFGEQDVALFHEIGREELVGNNNPSFHELIHASEIPSVLLKLKEKLAWLWFDFAEDIQYSGASVIRNVTEYRDSQVPENEAFLLIITEVHGQCILYCEGKEIVLERWAVYYLDPHMKHGVHANSSSYALVVRIPVLKK